MHRGKKIHFIGIAGTAMAAGAQLARELGFSVRGSDQNVYPPTSSELQAAQIAYHEGYSTENIGYHPDLVVLGNAISRGNPELEYALDHRLEILSLPEFIADFAIGKRRSFVITGTHGKTTTTALCAHAFRQAKIDAGYLVGGVAANFSTSAALGTADIFVIEGDEYDTSIFDPRPKFLSYRPTHVVINNIEFDHGDIFADLAEIEKAFARLIKIIPANGVLVTNADNPLCMKLAAKSLARVVSFGESPTADYRLIDCKTERTTEIHAELFGTKVVFQSPLFGRHNALNALAALALCEVGGVTREQFFTALRAFRGVKRRLEIRLKSDDFLVIEDFAHHPTAIRANLQTLRSLYPKHRLVVLLEPRSNTMVRNIFQTQLADALGEADVIFIDRIYRAEKYRPEERLDTNLLAETLQKRGRSVFLLPDQARGAAVTSQLQPGDVVCFMTNGNFSGLIDELVAALA